MADARRPCGFCGQEIDRQSNEGHNIDCIRAAIDKIPVATAPPPLPTTVAEVDQLSADVKRWRGNLDVMGEEMLEKALRLIPVLEGLAMTVSGTRSGPNVQIRAAQTLVDLIERIMKMVEAHKEAR